MPKVMKEDQASTWTIDGDSKTWTLQQQATITVNGEAAIDVLNTSLVNRLKLLGDIVASGDGGRGVHVAGVNTKIIVGKQAEIDADEGIGAAANGLRVVNKGEIDGLHYGVANSASSTITNFGDISADVAISTLGTSKVINGEDGMIQGDIAGVIMTVGNGSTLINHGLISGNDFAIRMQTGGENSIVNTGTIHGDILFGIGNDLLNSMKGTIEGTVSGGDGDANGNDEDNLLHGNSGRNTLNGGAGDDEIGGGEGDDTMSGDDGNDMFIFNKGDDHDIIVGFVDGEDTIQLGGFDGVTNFEELHFEMFKNGSDVWIQLGGGDRLIIQSTDLGDLDASDFSFVA